MLGQDTGAVGRERHLNADVLSSRALLLDENVYICIFFFFSGTNLHSIASDVGSPIHF